MLLAGHKNSPPGTVGKSWRAEIPEGPGWKTPAEYLFNCFIYPDPLIKVTVHSTTLTEDSPVVKRGLVYETLVYQLSPQRYTYCHTLDILPLPD